MPLSPTFLPSAPISADWTPILEGELAIRAEAALEAITQALPKRFYDRSLSSGSAGAALYYAYLALSGRGDMNQALAHLHDAAASLGGGRHSPSLYGGFTGIAWAVGHVRRLLPESPEEDLNEAIDEALLDFVGRSPWRLDYDLVSGLVGYGLYALDRLERPTGFRILRQVITRLDETKTRMLDGLAWRTAPVLLPEWQREMDPDGYYNLGLAHGNPAVIALLAQACQAGVPEALPLLEGAVSWLLAQQLPEGAGCCFRTTVPVGPGRQDPNPSRIAWCYGDLGLGVALLWAARIVGRDDWERSALAVLRACAGRGVVGAGVRDAGLCHGAAGNAHLFNRVWQATGEEALRRASLLWFERALALRKEGWGLAGSRAFMPSLNGEDTRPWVDHPGLLEGCAGIGLALLAALAPQRPDWDRFLMVCLPPRGVLGA